MTGMNIRGPRAEVDWMDRANCTLNPDLFFADDNAVPYSREERQRIKAAKALCAACPVATQCLDTAIREQRDHGVWGGLTAKERKGLVRT